MASMLAACPAETQEETEPAVGLAQRVRDGSSSRTVEELVTAVMAG